ncbi:hypothetical protein [Shewanella sp. UCD-KL12]|uniref:hypothetical protein n=1 Tax=Shewanella sp. UCD-KL12 TaxID=1917163 RepID=UPI0009714279|nr:hypothetical protein [Shewanella sp. UCD-KL12]
MQIHSNTPYTANTTPVAPSSVNQAVTAANQAQVATGSPLPNITDTVTLSAQALALSQQPPMTSKDAETLPVTPNLPNQGEKVDDYVEFRKAKAQYQVYSDIAGMATGNSNNISAPTAYYLSNNDEARSAVVDNKAQQQNVSAMQAYAQASQDAQEWYE